jgi:hypothetical protein
MKILKKSLIVIASLILVSSVAGYLYFDKKFTPKSNNLNVSGESSTIPIYWKESSSTKISALLLKIKIKGIEDGFYMQFDTGSPNTIFYKSSLDSIQKLYGLADFNEDATKTKLSFSLGKMDIKSDDFLVYNVQKNWSHKDSIKIVGTLGTDVMEFRTTKFDFRNSKISFDNTKLKESNSDFKFQKRRILIPVTVSNKKVNVIYDSGTSGFEYITSKDIWEKMKTENKDINLTESNSMGRVLKTYTTGSNSAINFQNESVNLKEVTYIEGYSSFQYLMMKFTGMGGMLGNKLLIDKIVTFDCENEKYSIE